jgi:hypothetical protein
MKPATIVRAALVALAVASAAHVAAQTLYKLIDKNGKITYSESAPKPGEFDGQVIPMNIDPNANNATLPKAAPDAFKSKENELPPPAVLNARDKLARAQRALGDARANPSESDMQRMGNVGGGARLVPTEAYQQKIAQLEKDVHDAEEEVRRAEAAWKR